MMKKAAGIVYDRQLAARPNARVDTENANGSCRRREEKVLEILPKDANRFRF